VPAELGQILPWIHGATPWILAVAWVWGCWAAGPGGPRRTVLVAGVLSALLARLTTAVVDTRTWPVTWFDPIREGDASGTIGRALGSQGYGLREGWWTVLGVTPMARLDATVEVHLALAVGVMVWAGAWVWTRTGSAVAAVAFPVALAWTPLGRVAVTSGEPGPLLWCWGVVLVGGWTAASSARSVAGRGSGRGWAPLAAAVLAWARHELVLLWLVPAGLMAASRLGLGSWWASRSTKDRRRATGLVVAVIVGMALVPPRAVDALSAHDMGLALGVRALHPREGTLVWGPLFALAAFGVNLSVSAAVGLIALLGQVALGGLLVVGAIQTRLDDGALRREAAIEGAIDRMRPVLMTALLAMLGLVPMAVGGGVGSETQQPFALVIVGGMTTTLPVALLLLPALAGAFLTPQRTTKEAA